MQQWGKSNMKMFNYLNHKQINDMMLLFCVGDKVEEIVNTWVQYENMTKEEAKYIRTSRTFYNKFFDSIQARLSDREASKLIKRYSNFHLSIQDKWLLKKFHDDMNEAAKTVRMERKQFEKFATQLFNINCKDCTKTSDNCEIHDLLYENLYPTEEKLKNCCYAFESHEAKLERLKREEAKRLARESKKSKVTKRSKKKKSNRYDEDDEIIEYNFTPKGDK